MASNARGTSDTAEGMPTKRLFIDTLVRDIDLAASIVDLIDNSIDGAKRIKPQQNFQNLWVNITLNGQEFVVADNCGGIDLEIARKYAFRFGRDENYKGEVKNSVGHFGVGMKRTLFKIAQKFTVASVTKTTKFQLVLDVSQWEKEKEWDFPLTHVEKSSVKPNKAVGTFIEANKLRPDAAEQFALTKFVNEVRERVRRAHSRAISKGIKIDFNGETLTAEDFFLRKSAQIKPLQLVGEVAAERNRGKVKYRILAGVDDRSSSLSGWYVFCNDRLLLWADQSAMTGWGEAPAPKFHQQFNYFRGYVFLDSKDAGVLPWNTTKTGVSEDSEIYAQVRPIMRDATRKVIDFLNELRKEEVAHENNTIAETPLHDHLKNTKRLSVTDSDTFKESAKFVWPKSAVKRPAGTKERRITYKVPLAEFEAVKGALNASSPEEVGLDTFKYYYSVEIEG